jgi:hypothetical protein
VHVEKGARHGSRVVLTDLEGVLGKKKTLAIKDGWMI